MRQAEEDCLPQMIWKANSHGQAEGLNKRFMGYTGATEDLKHTVNLFAESVVHKGIYEAGSS